MKDLPRADGELDALVAPKSLELARELIAQGHHPVAIGRSLVVVERTDARTLSIRIHDDPDLFGGITPESIVEVTCRKYGIDAVVWTEDGKVPRQLFSWREPKASQPVDGAVAAIHSMVERKVITAAMGRKEFAHLASIGWLASAQAAHESSLLHPD
jgi:hypothetical protein